MTEKFYSVLTEVLGSEQMSISNLARELKKRGYDMHRLILTGYLRALHDTGYLEEMDIPPSKVYKYYGENKKNDIYFLLKKHLAAVNPDRKLPVAVNLIYSLFNRPCFRCELELLGIEAKRSFSSLNDFYIKESKDPKLNEYRADVTRINVPKDDPAFEPAISEEEKETITWYCSGILFNILGENMNLDGLRVNKNSK